jgi:aryl-alcohol dehydrogenase-like predicted oxidoreductase
VGKALRSRRDGVILATKFGLPMGDDPHRRGASRRWIVRAIEGSLRRLDTDWIDLYQLHRADYATDIDETLSALSDLVTAGKIRAFGSSTFPADYIVEAQWAAERGGRHRFLSEQPRYSILNRSLETAVLPTAERYGMGVLTYGPLGSGWLSGRDPSAGHRVAGAPQAFDLAIPGNRAKADAVQQLLALAAEAGLSLPHLATAFPLAHRAVTSVIIGPRTPKQLQDSLDAADVVLGPDILDRIDEIVKPGTDVNPADNYNADPPALLDAALRRR